MIILHYDVRPRKWRGPFFDKIKKLFYFLPNTGITINEASLNTSSTVIFNLAGCVFFRVQCGKQKRGDDKIIQ